MSSAIDDRVASMTALYFHYMSISRALPILLFPDSPGRGYSEKVKRGKKIRRTSVPALNQGTAKIRTGTDLGITRDLLFSQLSGLLRLVASTLGARSHRQPVEKDSEIYYVETESPEDAEQQWSLRKKFRRTTTSVSCGTQPSLP
jgi:hypothetical protein